MIARSDRWSLWQRVLTSVYRRASLMVRDLAVPVSVVTPHGITLALLTASDIDAYLRFRGKLSRREVDDRLSRGEVAVLAWRDGRIVQAAWAATGRVHLGYLARSVQLGPRDVLVHDSYTAPDCRLGGLAVARMAFLFGTFRDRGFRRCFAIVARENVAGYRALCSTGYVAVGQYTRLRFGIVDRCGFVPTMPVPDPPIILSSRNP